MSYWKGYTRPASHQVNGITTDDEHRGEPASSSAFEEEPTDKELGVQLNNVSKVN